MVIKYVEQCVVAFFFVRSLCTVHLNNLPHQLLNCSNSIMCPQWKTVLRIKWQIIYDVQQNMQPEFGASLQTQFESKLFSGQTKWQANKGHRENGNWTVTERHRCSHDDQMNIWWWNCTECAAVIWPNEWMIASKIFECLRYPLSRPLTVLPALSAVRLSFELGWKHFRRSFNLTSHSNVARLNFCLTNNMWRRNLIQWNAQQWSAYQMVDRLQTAVKTTSTTCFASELF